MEEGMTVIPPRRSEAGLFKIVMGQDADNLSVPLAVAGKEFLFPLRKLTAAECEGRLNPNPRAEGLLYTLYNCTTGGMADIPNSTFDTAVSNFGRLTRMVEHQRHRGSEFFNGNRFFCMVASGPMPDSVEIANPKTPDTPFHVTIGFKGKGYYCARCLKRHIGPCPAKEDFYAAKEFRAAQTIESLILTDSTLRLADTTGLSTDIISMSGGRVGHVAHMIKDVPKIDTKKNILILAGSNDISREQESVDFFEDKIRKGVGNMQHLVYGSNHTLTVVGPPSYPGLSPLARRKRDRLDVLMQELSTKPDNAFKYVPCTQPIQSENGHPTEDGTKELLHFINATLPIILNGKFITTARLYDGVTTAYRYGCLHCLQHIYCNDDGLCPACVKVLAPDPPDLTSVGDANSHSPSEVHMSETENKRLSGESPVSTPHKMFKSNDGSHN